MYENSAADVVDQVLSGYNATVFAYGATGSGKTYTMVGSDGHSGIMVRTLDDIFKKIKESSDRHYSVNVSYLEIYNEQIHDLLETESGQRPLPNLKLFENKEDGTPIIPKLRHEQPKSAEEVFCLLKLGNSRRSQAATNQNKVSSRSHAILQVIIKSKPKGPAINHELRVIH